MLRWLQRHWRMFLDEMAEVQGVPFVAALIAVSALLFTTPQGTDLAITAGSDVAGAVGLALASLFFGFECWLWTRFIIERRQSRAPEGWQVPWLQEWTPRVLGAAPFFIDARATFHADVDEWWLPWVLAVLGLVMLFGLWIRRGAIRALRLHLDPRLGKVLRQGSLVLAVVAMVVASLDLVGPAQALGAIGVVYVGLAFITAFLAAALHYSRSLRLPIFTGLVVWATLLSLFVDNHAVGRRAFGPAFQQGGIATAPPSLDDSFKAWCAAQPDCKPGPAPIPIVFVAAEGGASRAGYWTADVLGDLQSLTAPARFSDRVFAISSVSGGSVGAVAFLSQLHDDPDLPAGQFRKTIADVAGDDFLSPAVGGLLFPDLLQRFLPVAFLPDRAEALERAFEASWSRHCRASGRCGDADLWSEGFLSLWRNNKSWQPVLLINGARQEDGRRIITSNIDVTPDEFPDAVDFHYLTRRDVRVSTAISNGARFPLVSPGGTLTDSAGKTWGHVLDGGYVDGGGVPTMADVASAVLRIAKAGGYALRPIFIEINNDSSSDDDAPDLVRTTFTPADRAALGVSKTNDFMADVLGPLDGLYRARGARGTAAAMSLALTIQAQAAAAKADQGAGAAQAGAGTGLTLAAGGWGVSPSYHMVHLCKSTQMPMDWALSAGARRRTDAVLDTPATPDCRAAAEIQAIVSDIGAAGAARP